MRPVISILAFVLLAGCATDSQGRRETAWEALKRWDESMTQTEERLHRKSYND